VCRLNLQGLGTSDCKTELCTRHILANSSIDRRAQPQIAVERFAVLDFRRSLANPRLQSDAPRLCSTEVASQRANAASSWTTLEGGVLDSFKRLRTERVTVGLYQRLIA
jgi:hypothetical protein